MPVMQPNAFLSAALPAMPLPPAGSSSSQAIRHDEPPACEAWTDVSEDGVCLRALYSRVTATGGGSSGPSDSGTSSSSPSGSRIPLEGLAIWLTDNADEIFCDTSGAALLLALRKQANVPMGQRVNEAQTRHRLCKHLLDPLEDLINALLDQTNASGGGSAAAAGAAGAGATAAAGGTSEGSAVPAGATAGAGGGGTAWSKGVSGVVWMHEDRLHTEQVLLCQLLSEGGHCWRLYPDLTLVAYSANSENAAGASGAAGAAASTGDSDSTTACADAAAAGICMVAVKAAAALMENGSPIALLEKWEQKDPKVRAMIAQAYTYMSRGGIPYGILTDYHVTFLLRLARAPPPPPPQPPPPPAAGSSSSRGAITRGHSIGDRFGEAGHVPADE